MINLINEKENIQLNREFYNLADLSKEAALNICQYSTEFENSADYGYIDIMQLTHFTRNLDFNNLSQIAAARNYLSFCQKCIEEYKDKNLLNDDREEKINLNDELIEFMIKLDEIAMKQFNHNLENISKHLHQILTKIFHFYYIKDDINYLHIYSNILNYKEKETLFLALKNDLLLRIKIYELLPVLAEIGIYKILENEIEPKKEIESSKNEIIKEQSKKEKESSKNEIEPKKEKESSKNEIEPKKLLEWHENMTGYRTSLTGGGNMSKEDAVNILKTIPEKNIFFCYGFKAKGAIPRTCSRDFALKKINAAFTDCDIYDGIFTINEYSANDMW